MSAFALVCRERAAGGCRCSATAPRGQPSRRSRRHRRRRRRFAFAAARDASHDGAAQSRRARAPARRSAGPIVAGLPSMADAGRDSPRASAPPMPTSRASRDGSSEKASLSTLPTPRLARSPSPARSRRRRMRFAVKIAATPTAESIPTSTDPLCPPSCVRNRIDPTASTTCCTARPMCRIARSSASSPIVNNGQGDGLRSRGHLYLLRRNAAAERSASTAAATAVSRWSRTRTSTTLPPTRSTPSSTCPR